MTADTIQDHYGLFARNNAILAGLEAAGKNVSQLTPDDLAPFDHLHTAGHSATMRMVALLSPRVGQHILDVGCGIGGPARLLAHLTHCTVTGIDLTPEFVVTAQDLTKRTGQSEQVHFQQASAMALPFADQTFDGAWHLHMSMNVADKTAMYAEIFRVLKPGARFAMFDPIRGETVDPPLYPVPWAATDATSFLLRRTEMIDIITAAGFNTIEVTDATANGVAWFAEIAKARAAGTAPAHPPQDPRFLEMSKNHRRNLEAGAISLMRGLFERP